MTYRLSRGLRICSLIAICLATAASPWLRAQSVLDTRPETGAAEAHPSGWWPKDGAAPRSAYAGPESCEPCHKAEFADWQSSQMAHAICPAAKSDFLAGRRLTYQWGPYRYTVDNTGNQAVYSVSDGRRKLSIPLLWAYGTGVVGQAFIFRLDQTYYEAEVAFYPVLGHLDVVAGLSRTPPTDLRQAFGLPLSPDAARQCIVCHTTAAVTSHRLNVESVILGVTCEACHGPGAQHVAAMKAGARGVERTGTSIMNPAHLSPADLEGFCGACHRTSERVIGEGLHGLDTVHYEPYRLEMSQCWIMSQQITCITCHNPHQPLARGAAAYDAACLSCHSGAAHAVNDATGNVCPVAKRNCVTCHMPKCRLPLSPFSMSDHFIRIVRPGDACAKS